MKTLSLDILDGGINTLSNAVGCFYREAALYCLSTHNHAFPLTLEVYGDNNTSYQLQTSAKIDEKAEYSWADSQEATEYAATGLGIVLALDLTQYTNIERSFKGTGFDYWLGNANQEPGRPFNRHARLEVSGILRGNKGKVDTRTRQKVAQTMKSDESGIDAFVVVSEFSAPIAKFVKR